MGVISPANTNIVKHIPPEQPKPRARAMRRDPTEAEKRLWYLLREHWPTLRFRRQVPIAHYIVDFASHRLRLVIELDGGQHNAEIDAARNAIIESQGYFILRFWNHELLGNEDGALQMIASTIADRTPSSNSR